MINQIKYALGSLFALPLLPIMYLQGKQIRKSVPKLPEAQNPSGEIKGADAEILNVVTLGESTIAGIGVKDHIDGFTGALAQTIGAKTNKTVRWRAIARSGYTAERVKEKLVKRLPKEQIDLLIIGLGGNDAFKLHSPNKWHHDIDQLIFAIREKHPTTPICFTNMPPIKNFPAFTWFIQQIVGNLVEILGAELQIVAKKHPNVYYNEEVIKLNVWKKRWDINLPADQFFSDGVHPAPITYQTWGKDMANFIAKQKVL